MPLNEIFPSASPGNFSPARAYTPLCVHISLLIILWHGHVAPAPLCKSQPAKVSGVNEAARSLYFPCSARILFTQTQTTLAVKIQELRESDFKVAGSCVMMKVQQLQRSTRICHNLGVRVEKRVREGKGRWLPGFAERKDIHALIKYPPWRLQCQAALELSSLHL